MTTKAFLSACPTTTTAGSIYNIMAKHSRGKLGGKLLRLQEKHLSLEKLCGLAISAIYNKNNE